MDTWYTDVGQSHPKPKRSIAIGNDGKIIIDSIPKEMEREVFYMGTGGAARAIENLLTFICRDAPCPKDELENLQFLIDKKLQQLKELNKEE